ncbi:MAG: helix-turn-helix transcriptional regulator [Actinomycetota bacterium]|nr:helix-turn-helix transcriptional regulator [Actinomycetota bacterium]
MSEIKKCRSKNCSCGAKRMDRFLVPSILLLLSEGGSYGYELTEKYSKIGFTQSGNDFGAIYRTLNFLEKEGLIKSQWETSKSGPAKKNYSITDKGDSELAQWVEFIKYRENILKTFLKRFNKIKGKKGF